MIDWTEGRGHEDGQDVHVVVVEGFVGRKGGEEMAILSETVNKSERVDEERKGKRKAEQERTCRFVGKRVVKKGQCRAGAGQFCALAGHEKGRKSEEESGILMDMHVG